MQKTISEVHYTREVLLAELEEARKMAIKKDQPSAAVSATIGKARVLGLIIDRREVGDVGRFDSWTDEQLVKEAARLARSLGIAGPHLVEDDSKSGHDDAKS